MTGLAAMSRYRWGNCAWPGEGRRWYPGADIWFTLDTDGYWLLPPNFVLGVF